MNPHFKTLRHWFSAAVLGSAALGAVGCSAVVERADANNDYGRYVSSLYNEPASSHGPRAIEFPINVAVAQVGQAAPSQPVLDKLRAAPDVFRRVGTLQANLIRDEPAAGFSRDFLQRLESQARDQGADYVLIYGATVDTHVRVQPWSGLDFTLVGAFVVPSREIIADARASCALIDVRSGTVVLTTAGQATDGGWASAASVDAVQDITLGRSAQKSFMNMLDQFVAEAKRRTADDNIAAANETRRGNAER